jgi:LPS-assembly lipoprotein
MKRSFFLLPPSAFLLAAAALLLAGCGFQLRGEVSMPFDSIYVQSPVASPIVRELKRAVAARFKATVMEEPGKAQVILHLMDVRQEKEILTLSGGGRVSEFQLRYRVSYRLTDNKSTTIYIPPSEIVMGRTLTYSDLEASAKQGEEALLYRDMQQDAVQQMMRRLQAAKLQVKS